LPRSEAGCYTFGMSHNDPHEVESAHAGTASPVDVVPSSKPAAREDSPEGPGVSPSSRPAVQPVAGAPVQVGAGTGCQALTLRTRSALLIAWALGAAALDLVTEGHGRERCHCGARRRDCSPSGRYHASRPPHRA
jgi:hypothetical protein